LCVYSSKTGAEQAQKQAQNRRRNRRRTDEETFYYGLSTHGVVLGVSVKCARVEMLGFLWISQASRVQMVFS